MASYGANALQGTGTGAAAGAAFGPWGAAIGGALGLGMGLFSAYEQAESEKERREIIEKAAKEMNASYDDIKRMFEQYKAENPSIGRQSDVEKYRDLVDTYDPSEFEYNEKNLGVKTTFDDSEFDDIDKWYAPNRQAIIDKTADSIQHRAAGMGIGRGTGAANMIATGVADKNEELYKDALQARNADRQFAYSLWQTNIQNAQNRLKSLQEGKRTQMDLYGNLAEDFQNYNQAMAQTEMDLAKQKANNNMSLTLASI